MTAGFFCGLEQIFVDNVRMPLRKGTSRATRDRNIGQMMESFKKTGKIGHTKPRNSIHARQIAGAAANRNRHDTKKKRKPISY